MDISSLTLVAIRAAYQAGEILRQGFGRTYKISSKTNKYDLVTEYDKHSEQIILQTIQDPFPSHQFLTEESGQLGNENAPILWIIDPLDGTMNFARRIPLFSVSIAVAIEKSVVVGIVYQPITQELFVAEKGKGSFLNGARLKVTATAHLEDAFVSTGFPVNVSNNPDHCIEAFAEVAKTGAPIRRLGSAAIDLAYVAAGRFDAFWEVRLQPWDIAAGMLLIQEAGGSVSHYDGTDHKLFCYDTLLATNGHLHQQMIERLNS